MCTSSTIKAALPALTSTRAGDERELRVDVVEGRTYDVFCSDHRRCGDWLLACSSRETSHMPDSVPQAPVVAGGCHGRKDDGNEDAEVGLSERYGEIIP